MATYKQAGVDIGMGDTCSALAYAAAKKTFASRKGMIGRPVVLDGGFSGALDFGNFYLVQNCDGVGSKIAVADAMKKYDTLGYDLLAMVADDAVCMGAETVAITNTIDTQKVSDKAIGPMMDGLRKACIEQKVVIPGGEIAEMPDQVTGNMWNSTALGIVEKKRIILGKNVKPGDKIIGLKSRGFRSNGFSLIRHILKKKFGTNWHTKKLEGTKTWGEAVLTPSLIYSGALLEVLGRYGKKRTCNIKALAHVTGGGIPGNIVRVLGRYGAKLDNLWGPLPMMLKLQELGKVDDREAYNVWNMGVGMIVISNEFKKIEAHMKKHGIKARIIGEVTPKPGVELKSLGFFSKGKFLRFL
ncbi:MAG TPA: phosphoribosylformylglycinamidine cyclo-ligase [Candidatus Gracilibacteria bacterium]|nr:phosphoribosylformylglycinamidine cyclo-ligase [Candidatus Gracilibacteria bacterium]